jgi:hypothetical protein
LLRIVADAEKTIAQVRSRTGSDGVGDGDSIDNSDTDIGNSSGSTPW